MSYSVIAGDSKNIADRLNDAKLLGPFPAQGLPLGTLTLIFSDPAATATFDGSAGDYVTVLGAVAEIAASFPSAVMELRRNNDMVYIAIWYGDGFTIDKDGTANTLLGLSTTADTVSEGAVDVTRIRGFSQGSTNGHYSLILSDQPGAADPGIGDVDGPATSTDDAIARFDGTTGKIIQNSAVTIDNAGNVSVPASATVDGRDISVDGATLDGHTASITSKANRRLARRDITGTTGALVQTDEDTGAKTSNAAAVSLTIDQLVAGTVITVMQTGTGQITSVAGSGVTLEIPLGGKSLFRYATLVYEWITATQVRVSGETAV